MKLSLAAIKRKEHKKKKESAFLRSLCFFAANSNPQI
jgi:hypothetical protein